MEFHHNVIAFERARVRGVANIGAHTAPETFRFHHNLWFASDDPKRSRPNLPVPESNSLLGIDPKLDPGTRLPAAPEAQALLRN